ncbi:Fc receptor-like protein 5 [Melanotaenia boesemani]|uniref:Fc receptor-like protein 5 n=1 Tax=Melanotaenia boesemani TaxID=1250792 RepID=UPI001C050E18|nr:Fc receptor-like protein 5 [Melanotaenia boesemani]
MSTVSNRVTVTLQPSWTLIYRGEYISARCEIQEGGGTQWTYEWRTTSLKRPPSSREHWIDRVTDSGDYSCRGRRDEFYLTQWSDVVSVTVSEHEARARLTADSSILPAGGSVTLTCSVDHSADWKFNWFRDGSVYPAAQLRNNNEPGGVIRVSQGGLYRCRGGRGEPVFYTEDSHDVTIEETLSTKPTVVLQPSWTLIYRGETITARCEIQEGGGTQWTYEWRPTRLNRPPSSREHRIIRVTDSGDYSCRGRRDEFYLTQWSDVVSVTVSDKPRPVLSVSPSWLSPGSSVTLRCEIKPPSAGWRFYWYKAVPDLSHQYISYSYELLPGSPNGTAGSSTIVHGQTHTAGYVCRAERVDRVYSTDHSQPTFVWSEDVHPAASLTVNPDRVQHFTSDSVSLNCGGNSAEWRVMSFTETHHLSRCSSWGRMTGSSCNMNWYHSGVYWCESGSGEFSNTVNITVQNDDDGVILVSPIHPVTEGASVSLSCRLREQNTLSSVSFYHNDKLLQHDGREELNISAVSQSDEGFYKCQHAGKTSQQSWMSVTDKPRPVLSVSPSWLSPGSSVTLRCEIKPPSAGWRFYWYKAVPDLLNNSYSYDLLPCSTAGTEHDSYIIHGQTHTAGYVCRAGRVDRVYSTNHSQPTFVWSEDVHPAASLTVNPDRVQHFTSDSVSLNCGGNSAEWRVMRFTETHHLSRCSSWGRMTGSSCNMNWYHSGVYWCESGSGEFSNTVNITVQNDDDGVILVSPVHPVTEGASVSLSCRLREQNTLSSVSFYHNDKLLQHDGREELNISAVSQSDEGFYKCQHAGKTSQQSWMSVTAVSRPENSSFPVLLMVGSVIGIILLIFLLLLCLCKRSKDLCCIRWIQSQSSSQSSSSHPGVNQNETNQYSSPLHDADESRDGTYSLIELKHFGKKRRRHEPEESCVYSEVKTGTAESTPVYAEINHENKGKGKRKNKRKWSPAAGDAAVYSEVGLGAALDNNAAM